MNKIKISEPYLDSADAKAVFDNVLHARAVSTNLEDAKAVERALTDITGYARCCLVNNGSSALLGVFSYLREKRGVKTIAIPNITFGATVNAAFLAGLTPILVDVDYATGLISSDFMKQQALEPTIDAICVVSLNGRSVSHDLLAGFGHEGPVIIEDAAECLVNHEGRGARGNKGIYLASTFSFYGNKIITSGEGGAVATDSADMIEFLASYKSHGMRKAGKYQHQIIGNNVRLSGLATALLRSQLDKLQDIKAARRAIWKDYLKQLQGQNDIQTCDLSDEKIPWLMEVKSPGLVNKLSALSVPFDWRPMFEPMHWQEPYSKLDYLSLFNQSDDFHRDSVFLPLHPYLTKEDVNVIVQFVKKAVRL